MPSNESVLPSSCPPSARPQVDAQLRDLAAHIEKTVPANIVQSIRAYQPTDLQAVAQCWGQHFLYAQLSEATTKQRILHELGEQFLLPGYFGRNLDALFDCLTDTLRQAGAQPGFVVVLEHIPISSKFDKEMREQLLDVFRDAAEFWAERKVPFRCFYSFF